MTQSNSRSSAGSLHKRWKRWRHASARSRSGSIDAARVIRESGLFDPIWYLKQYPDVAAAAMDPLDHFLTHGGAEGRKAGPAFDSRWYCDQYPDVIPSNLHPLVHYVVYGEGRDPVKPIGIPGHKTSPHDLREAAEILASPLFDAAWYERVHQLRTKGRATALHYLKLGAPAGLNPGRHFDGRAYLRAYDDVRDAGANPLLHFIRHGEAEGRQAFAVQDGGEDASSGPFVLREGRRADAPETTLSDINWTSSGELRAGRGTALVKIGKLPIGLLTEVYDDQTEPLPITLRSALNDACKLSSLNPVELLSAKKGRSTRNIPDSPNDAGTKSLEPSDGWFVSDGLLRLRFAPTATDSAVRLLQIGRDGHARLVGEAPLTAGAMHLVDARLFNSFDPVLVVHTRATGRIIGGGLMPFPSLFRGGIHGAETEAASEGAAGSARREILSRRLLRDAIGWQAASDFSVGSIRVDLKGATGAERIFSPSTLNWLAGLGLSVGGLPSETDQPDPVWEHLESALSAASAPISPRASTGVLTLPCDALPTLSAVMSRRPVVGARYTGSYLVCDSTSPVPRWMVSMPPFDDSLLDVQPAAAPLPFPLLSSGKTGPSPQSKRTGVLAIRYRDQDAVVDATLSYPVAPDAPVGLLAKPLSPSRRSRAAITAVILVDQPLIAVGLLESLARQTMADRLLVVVAASSALARALEGHLQRLFPGRSRTVAIAEGGGAAAINAAVESAGRIADMLLLVSQNMALHDPRTLETLYLVASHPKTASAACVRVREGGFRDGARMQFQSGGFFPSHFDVLTSPALTFATPETLGVFPLATYPVAGNDLALAMIPAARWKSLGGLDAIQHPFEGYGLDFAIRALKAGFVHLCTSAVTATDVGSGGPGDMGKTASPPSHPMELGEWALSLERIAMLRALG